jgi:hypothetical protein
MLRCISRRREDCNVKDLRSRTPPTFTSVRTHRLDSCCSTSSVPGYRRKTHIAVNMTQDDCNSACRTRRQWMGKSNVLQSLSTAVHQHATLRRTSQLAATWPHPTQSRFPRRVIGTQAVLTEQHRPSKQVRAKPSPSPWAGGAIQPHRALPSSSVTSPPRVAAAVAVAFVPLGLPAGLACAAPSFPPTDACKVQAVRSKSSCRAGTATLIFFRVGTALRWILCRKKGANS